MKKIQFIFVITFLISVYAGFIYTLSMLTDVTLLNFYQDFLDDTVGYYVDEAQEVNQLIFRLSLFLVVISALLYTFSPKKSLFGKNKLISALVLGVISIVINIFMYIQLVYLNTLYHITDTGWPADYPITAEQLGYFEPGNEFIAFGPIIYTITTLISIVFVVWFIVQLTRKLKEFKL